MAMTTNPLFPNANSTAELDGLEEFFDLSAASSGETWPLYNNWETSLPYPSSKLWADSTTRFNFDLGGNSSSNLLFVGHEEIDSSSPFASQLSLPSSLDSTPSAIFSSSSTNFLSLPEDPFGDLIFEYNNQDALEFSDTSYNSITLPDPLAYGHIQTEPTSPHASLPTFRLQNLSNEDSPIMLDSIDDAPQSEISSMDISATPPNHIISPSIHGAALPECNYEGIHDSHNSPQTAVIPWADPGVRRSTRLFTSPHRQSLYYDPDPAPQSSSSSKRVPKRKLDDDEYDDETQQDRAAQPHRRSRPLPRRRKAETILCTMPGCGQTFGRENDMKRHLLSAAVHEADRPFILNHLQVAPSPSKCEFCGENLSRRDARLRHERDLSCGKRTGRKKAGRMVSSTT